MAMGYSNSNIDRESINNTNCNTIDPDISNNSDYKLLSNNNNNNNNNTNITISKSKSNLIGYFQVFLLCLLTYSSGLSWLTYSTIPLIYSRYYSISITAINLLTMQFMLIYIIFTIITTIYSKNYYIINYILKLDFGLYYTSICMIIGSLLRILPYPLILNPESIISYILALLGQFLLSISQIYLFIAPTIISNNYFPISKHYTITSIILLTNSLGQISAFILNLLCFNGTEDYYLLDNIAIQKLAEINIEQLYNPIKRVLSIQSIICIIASIAVIKYFKSNPYTNSNTDTDTKVDNPIIINNDINNNTTNSNTVSSSSIIDLFRIIYHSSNSKLNEFNLFISVCCGFIFQLSITWTITMVLSEELFEINYFTNDQCTIAIILFIIATMITSYITAAINDRIQKPVIIITISLSLSLFALILFATMKLYINTNTESNDNLIIIYCISIFLGLSLCACPAIYLNLSIKSWNQAITANDSNIIISPESIINALQFAANLLAFVLTLIFSTIGSNIGKWILVGINSAALIIFIYYNYIKTYNNNLIKSIGEYSAIRLLPNSDLIESLLQFAIDNNSSALAIVTCVGSLNSAIIRLANQPINTEFNNGPYEICSLVGTITSKCDPYNIGKLLPQVHIHISISDKSGIMIGGHLMTGSIIYTTAEVVLVNLPNIKFIRTINPKINQTKWDELLIIGN